MPVIKPEEQEVWAEKLHREGREAGVTIELNDLREFCKEGPERPGRDWNKSGSGERGGEDPGKQKVKRKEKKRSPTFLFGSTRAKSF